MRLWRGRNRISPCRSQPEGAATRGAHLPRTRLSELTGRRRAQMLRRKTRRSGRSGQGNACEEQAQGNGETPVRVMRRRTQARLGGGIPPTKYRTADGGCSTREESSFSPEGATSMRRIGPAPEGAMRGFVSGRSRAEPSRVRRAPDGVYVYAEWGEGRRNRPLSQGEHGCPKQSRTLTGKPARDNTGQSANTKAEVAKTPARLPCG